MAKPGIRLVLQHLCQVAARQATEGVPDQQLLERFVVGRDEDAFTALVHRHGPMVTGVCRRLLREMHDAEDAFQATFLVLARKAASIRKGESVGSWLYGVALRVASKARVEAARRARREGQRPAPAAAEAGDALCWGELRSVLDEELGRLSASWRAPLILCYLEGQTQDEAARRLGWSKSTFRRRLERGRRLLQSRLARRGVTLSAGLVAPLLSESATAGTLSTGFTASMVKTALLFGSGQWIGTTMRTEPVTLAEGVLHSMVLAQCKLAAVMVLTIGLLAVSGLGAYQVMAEKVAQAPSAAPLPKALERSDAQPALAPRAPVDQFGDPLPTEALARLGTVRLQHGAMAEAIVFAPDGRSLASAGHDGVVHIWESATGKELLHIDSDRGQDFLGFGTVTGLAYAPDGKTLAGARINQPVCLWDVATGKELRQFGVEGYRGRWLVFSRARWVVFSPDGKTLAYGGFQDDPNIRLADVSTGKDLQQFGGHKGSVAWSAFSPDGTILASADAQTIHFFELASGRTWELARPDGQAVSFNSLSFSPDGKIVAAASGAKNLIRLAEVATGRTIRAITLTDKPEQAGVMMLFSPILFMPDGKTVISGHRDGFVRFWEVATGAPLREFRAHSGDVIALALSPDGQTLATSGSRSTHGEHTVRLWETATGKPLVHHSGPQQGIARLVFSPDSQLVATARSPSE
jgi:RNA polymerase sigma factor (sigma-70 family)